jgi:hypothetical protein
MGVVFWSGRVYVRENVAESELLREPNPGMYQALPVVGFDSWRIDW